MIRGHPPSRWFVVATMLAVPTFVRADPPWTEHLEATRYAPRSPAPVVPRIDTLPDAPWTHAAHWNLPQGCASPVVATTEGYAVALSNPGAVAFVSTHGELTATARLAAMVPSTIVSVGDGAVLAADGSGGVTLVAPDGSARGGCHVASPAVGTPLVRSDGSVVFVGQSESGTVFSVVSRSGERVHATLVPGAASSSAVLLPRDEVAVATGGAILSRFLSPGETRQGPALLRFLPSGDVDRAPYFHGVNALVVLDNGRLAAAVDSEILLTTAGGALRARSDIGGRVTWLAPLPDGRIAALRATEPEELVVLDADGGVQSRTPCPGDVAPPLVDPTGTMLLVGRTGTILAVDADGTVRWRVIVHENLRPPAIALPGGGIVVATRGNALLALH